MRFNAARTFMPLKIDNIIRNKVRKDNEIIYGGRAMNAQLPAPFQRHTRDYDIYSILPKARARQLENELDKAAKGDYYYTKQAMHPGTFKVMDTGFDNRKGTADDFGVVDYSKPSRKVKTVKIRGIRYAHLSERKRDAKRSLGEKQFEYRHEKDRKDLYLIKKGKQLRGLFGW